MTTRVLPTPRLLDYVTQKMLYAFVEAHCRHRVYDKLGREIRTDPRGGVGVPMIENSTICTPCAILFAQALRAEERT